MKINTELGVPLLDSSSEPPPILYKYLSDKQVENVLENGSVRFTSLSNTNDLFEIRATFKKIAGPKFIEMIKIWMQAGLKESSLNKRVKDTINNKTVKDTIDDVMERTGIDLTNYNEHIKNTSRESLKNFLKNDAPELVETMLIPLLNSDKTIEMFLKSLPKLLCFSLSEQANIAPMWAYYANNQKGFVIAFDTESSWFKEKEDGTQNLLRKVSYFDGWLEEALDDFEKVISSKTMDWAHEREWRIYSGESRVDSIKQNPEEPIHLVNFPPDAVQRIILGEKMKPDVQNKIKEIVSAKYPHAEIYRMQSDPLSTTMNEIKINR